MAGIAGLDGLSREQAERLASAYGGAWRVVARDERMQAEAPPPPYTLLTLLADAAERLGWPAETTARVAQRLFEDGWITYPRTDSVRVSSLAIQAARRVITAAYGPEWLGEDFRLAADATAQDAHEAIRPTDPAIMPERLGNPQAQALYRLIRNRFLAAFMRPARVRLVSLTLEKV